MNVRCFVALIVWANVSLGPVLVTGAECAAAAWSQEAGAQEPEETVLEGYLEVIVEDSDAGSRTLYFLISGNNRTPLRFATDSPDLPTGTRVRARGHYEAGGRFVVVRLERVVASDGKDL